MASGMCLYLDCLVGTQRDQLIVPLIKHNVYDACQMTLRMLSCQHCSELAVLQDISIGCQPFFSSPPQVKRQTHIQVKRLASFGNAEIRTFLGVLT